MIADLVKENRSCRRFFEDHSIELKILEELVNLARLSASTANLQPLKYILSCESRKNAEIFSCLAWAGYLKDWPGPAEGERPTAYIVIFGRQKYKPGCRLRSWYCRPDHHAGRQGKRTCRLHDWFNQPQGAQRDLKNTRAS